LLAGLELELGSCSGLELRAHDFSAGPDRVEHLEPWSAHNGLARQRRPGEGLGRRTHSGALLGGQLAGKTRVAKCQTNARQGRSRRHPEPLDIRRYLFTGRSIEAHELTARA